MSSAVFCPVGIKEYKFLGLIKSFVSGIDIRKATTRAKVARLIKQ